ncbi:MAG: hypothetical protein QOG79_1617 [Mycobacterium sp.]|jgi:hypothetical protein|nr:hypothetical protein [Mycobacterium sp.]MDT5285378.1 hypothetical protein [Mycobacterium sp.]MDT5298375.1 hypothetical protein [Mycobacterium sp.]
METVDLPVMPPLEPMLAKAQAKVPPEAGVWSYEPKWDGRASLNLSRSLRCVPAGAYAYLHRPLSIGVERRRFRRRTSQPRREASCASCKREVRPSLV